MADQTDVYIEKKQEGQKSLMYSNLRKQGEVEPTEQFQRGEDRESPNWHPEPVILPGHNIELYIHCLQDAGDPRCKITLTEKLSGDMFIEWETNFTPSPLGLILQCDSMGKKG